MTTQPVLQFPTHRIETRVQTVTPEIAKRWLAANKRNRKPSELLVDRWGVSMTRGEWMLNGEAVKIAADGTILDGQHRLMASVKYNVSFQTLVVSGLPAETQDTMDAGKSRTLGDILTINGWKSGSAVAATVTGIVRGEKYGFKNAFVSGSGAGIVTNREAMDRLIAEPGLEDVSREAQKLARLGIHGKSASVLLYTFASIDADDARYFFEKLITGGLPVGNPIQTLREALLRYKTDKGVLPQTFLAAITIKAWNKFRSGESVYQLKFRSGGANPEAFPEPR